MLIKSFGQSSHVVWSFFMSQVEITPKSLDSRYVYLLDVGKVMYIWYGTKSKNVTRSKTRYAIRGLDKNVLRASSVNEQV